MERTRKTSMETDGRPKTICVHKSSQREEQPEREREKIKARAQVGGGRVRAQVGENKGDKHGDNSKERET